MLNGYRIFVIGPFHLVDRPPRYLSLTIPCAPKIGTTLASRARREAALHPQLPTYSSLSMAL